MPAPDALTVHRTFCPTCGFVMTAMSLVALGLAVSNHRVYCEVV